MNDEIMMDNPTASTEVLESNRCRPLALADLGLALLLGVSAAQGAASSAEQNWPQWRGPLGSGIAPAANPPVTWSETSNLKWKVKLPGRGTSTPIVWDNQVFIQTAIPTGKAGVTPAAPPAVAAAPAGTQPGGRRGGGGMSVPATNVHQFAVLCLDRHSGKTLWQKVAREVWPHEGHHKDHGFSSFSPVTDGSHIYAYFGSRGLHCYDMKGNLRWEKDLGRMETKMGFGEGSSPVLSGNAIVVNWDHEGDDFIAAFDKGTGAELWRQSRDEDTSWSTPFILQSDQGTEVVVSATRKVRSYDLRTGKLLWECGGLGANAIPTPVTGHGMVYVMTGYNNPALLALRLGRSGDLSGTDAVVWSLKKSTPYVASPLLHGDFLYFSTHTSGRLSCFDAKSGKAHFEAVPLEGVNGIYASPVAAGGRIYFAGRNGVSVVIKASDKLEVLATNHLEEKFDASPALVGKELFLRGHENLYCLAEK